MSLLARSNSSGSETVSLALAQLNPWVGQVEGNAERVRAARATAKSADLIVFSELFLSGYPPEDLVLHTAFLDACRTACERLARETADGGPAILLGLPWSENGLRYNACALLDQGRVEAVRFKVYLPNYGVFDEKRVFDAGPLPSPVLFRGVSLGIPICEDIWTTDVVRHLKAKGAEFLIVPNGSPYHRGKQRERLQIVSARVSECGVPLIYVNQVGGQDDLVFDGASFVLDADGSQAVRLPAFREQLVVTQWALKKKTWRCMNAKGLPLYLDGETNKPLMVSLEKHASSSQEVLDKADYQACVLGLKDYVEKSRFRGLILGLSGGIDSALCAAMAADALGPERVRCVMLPSRYTSAASLEDATACAAALGIPCETVSIESIVSAFETALPQPLAGVAAENLQSRARGVVLMALSNSSGALVLTTGNKSEMATGYATLYGDMNGGFNPVKDLYKTAVYRLASLRNRWKPETALGSPGEVIPDAILVKAPSAELRENQTDQDSLPPYDVLDAILEALIETRLGITDIVALGYDLETVSAIERLLRLSEYKRRQSAPGVKLTPVAFGRDRRIPIVNGFETLAR